jgi:hypothetical protein
MRSHAAGSAEPASLPQGLLHALSKVARRVRLQRALEDGCRLAIAGLGIAAIGVCLHKTAHADAARLCFAVAFTAPVLGVLIGALRRLPALLPARLLDRVGRTPDLIASAWSFALLPAGERTAFMDACLSRAAQQAERVTAAAAFPLHAPRGWRAAVLLSLALAALFALQLKQAPVVIARPIPKPRLLHEEDLSAVAAELSALRAVPGDDPALRNSMDELNKLLEALHDGELDRLDALRELRAMEERIALEQSAKDDSALREALRGLGEAIGQDSLAKDLAAALAQADAEKARSEAEKLAALFAEQPPAKADAKQLQRALERGSKPKTDPAAEQERKRAKDELDRLLKKKQEQKEPLNERDQRLLDRKQRELDKLEREQQQREQAQRQLDQLQRELGQSGSALGQNQAQGASQHMQQGARELERMAQQQLSKEQREQLKQTLQQLRELISKQRQQQQQGQGGQQQQQQQAQNGQGQGQGQGQGKTQKLDLTRFGKLARGQQGAQPGQQGQQGQQGKDGQGQGQNGQRGMMLKPGGNGDGEPQALLEGDGDGDGKQRLQLQDGTVQGSSSAGQGGRPQQQAPTALDSKRVDTRVQGELGEGPSRSQVIREAGQHGFASRDYEKVHADYSRHAEAVLERDRVPGGYRFYVRRYFQLIRPRDEAPPRSAGAIPPTAPPRSAGAVSPQETHD